MKKRKIGILTGGGDCPGLNAVIRAVAKKAMIELDAEVIGIKDGYEGLVTQNYEKLSYRDVSGILTLGGTILGSSNVSDPYSFVEVSKQGCVRKDYSKKTVAFVKRLGLECLVCLGGDGTLAVGNRLNNDGIPLIGVPKTIDNDLKGTDVTFGFDTAVSIATEGIDRLHSTAQSHHRIMIIEVMGRTAGWLALHSGIAGGGDIILLPEIPYDIHKVADVVKKRNRRGKRFSIIVVSEGAKPKGGKRVVNRIIENSPEPIRLGGIGNVLGNQLEELTGISTRTVILGHLQRGGTPTAYDRVLATQFGTHAVDLIKKKKYGYMVAMKQGKITSIKLKDVAQGPRIVTKNHELIKAAISVGTSFGV